MRRKQAKVKNDLWSMHQVHLQQPSLQRAFSGTVVFKSIQKEGSALLNQVILHENIHNLRKDETCMN